MTRQKPWQRSGGAVWFALYLGTMGAHERIGWAGDHGAGLRVAFLALALVPEWAFWSLTPLLLVRDCRLGWRTLLYAGFAGVVIDGVVLPWSSDWPTRSCSRVGPDSARWASP